MTLSERNKITYLHFILSILVVFIHSINNEISPIQKIFSIEKGIGQFAVPLFFMLSGFLYFKNIYSPQDVIRKVKSRVYTILIPFAVWNIIYYVIHLLLKPGMNISIFTIIDAVFNYTYNPSFWFMFQLILLIAISPIIYYVLKKYVYCIGFLILLSLFVIFNIDIYYINEDAIIYFVLGALFSKLYNDKKIHFIDKKYALWTFGASVIFFLINRGALELCKIDLKYISVFTYTIILIRASFGFFIFFVLDVFMKYIKIYDFMEETFFLYAIHYMIVKAIIIFTRYITYRFFNIKASNLIGDIVFLLSPVVCVAVTYYLTRILKRRNIKIYNLLTGNR